MRYIGPVLFSEGVLIMRLAITGLLVAISFIPFAMVQYPELAVQYVALQSA
jgi:hypothetical protein